MAIAQDVRPMIDSTADLLDPEALRAAMSENGYVYLRGVGPREKITALRRVFLEHCRDAGWLDPSADLMEARWSGAGPYAESEPEYMAIYRKIVNHPTFNDLPADRFYMDLMTRLLGGPVLMHRMHIGRISFPNNVLQTTPAHQDFHYIRGSGDTYTIWTPLGETPPELGGLKVLKGSHRRGFLDHDEFPGQKFAAFGLGDDKLDQTGGEEWHTTGFTLGDAVVFHSHTVHGAMPNLTGNRLRLSVDNRYQRQGDTFGPAATRTHHNL